MIARIFQIMVRASLLWRISRGIGANQKWRNNFNQTPEGVYCDWAAINPRLDRNIVLYENEKFTRIDSWQRMRKEEVTLVNRHSHPEHHPNPRVSLNCLNWDYKYMIMTIDGGYKTSWVVYPVARNFCRSLFSRIGDFFSVSRNLIFATRTHWFPRW